MFDGVAGFRGLGQRNHVRLELDWRNVSGERARYDAFCADLDAERIAPIKYRPPNATDILPSQENGPPGNVPRNALTKPITSDARPRENQ